MWIPKTEDEILAAINTGSLHETATFEAKRQLPDKNRNIDLAIDVAAMSTDGGVIIYGLDEDENHFVTTISPVSLAGARERISSIVQSSISEVPSFAVNPIQSANEPGLGYIVLIVPPSARAPHMVIVRENHRFYGRTDTGNRLLSEAEVARLYQRRASVEVDFVQELRQEIASAPIPLDHDRGHLHLLAKPILPTNPFLSDATEASGEMKDLLSNIVSSARKLPFRQRWSPTLDYIGNWRRSLDGFHSHNDMDSPNRRMDLQFDFSGAVHLFCGRGADALEGKKKVFGVILAGLTIQFIYMAGKFYESKGYLGTVRLGIVLTGIQGAVLHSDDAFWYTDSAVPFQRDEYIRSTSAIATSMTSDYSAVASELVMPLIMVMSKERADPFRDILHQ